MPIVKIKLGREVLLKVNDKLIVNLTKLLRIAEDRDKWKELSKMICSIACGNSA